jgi:hypothetical protein
MNSDQSRYALGPLHLCGALCVVAYACSSASSDHPGAVLASGGEQADGGRSGSNTGATGNAEQAAGEGGDATGVNGAGSNIGGAGTAGSAGGATSDQEAGGDPGTGEPPVSAATCSETAIWSGATDVDGIPAASSQTLLSVTPDELDLAFVHSGLLYVAHRAQASATFAVGSPISIPSGFSAAQGAALSSDGKRLILVSDPDQKKLGQMTRPTRDAIFTGTVDESAFAAVNQDAVYTGKLYASPVVSQSDDQLFFNSEFPNGASTVVVCNGSSGANWTPPVQLSTQVFDGDSTSRRLPTGVSADARTLFYFNEESQQEEARWRDSAQLNSPLYDTVDLGARRGAAPNAACNRLYSVSVSLGDVVVERD